MSVLGELREVNASLAGVVRRLSKCEAVDAFAREAPPGCCALCDEPLPRRERQHGRPRVVCGDRECLALYAKLYAWERHQRRPRRAHFDGS